tara:strand:+ start:133 stop:567 length:435 start_codon:yes stop_codon:yes gene_type:complete
MKNLAVLFILGTTLSGCYQTSLTMMGPSALGASQGKALQSSISSAVNYTIKEKTGKTTLEHILIREKNRVIKKAALVEKTVKENSFKVRNKLINQKENLRNKKLVKNTTSNLKRVLHLKEFKFVEENNAFPANKQRYSYTSKPK